MIRTDTVLLLLLLLGDRNDISLDYFVQHTRTTKSATTWSSVEGFEPEMVWAEESRRKKEEEGGAHSECNIQFCCAGMDALNGGFETAHELFCRIWYKFHAA